MTKNLTLVAALPMGGGCMSALPAEVGEAKKPEPIDDRPMVFVPSLGCFIPADLRSLTWPPITWGPEC
jgi:hypothetical protein